jgi:hypothetical protein
MIYLIQILLLLLFLLYVQFSPQIGNIWIRDNVFSPYGAIKLIMYPLQEVKMWNIEMWDSNIFMWLLIGNIIFTSYKVILNYI